MDTPDVYFAKFQGKTFINIHNVIVKISHVPTIIYKLFYRHSITLISEVHPLSYWK